MHGFKISGWLIVCLCLPFCLSAQSLERKVFSNGGGSGTIGIHTYLYTFGEPVVGTSNAPTLTLTKGFHQPIDISVLPFSLEGPLAYLQPEGVLLEWRASLPAEMGVFFVERSSDGQHFENIHNQDALAKEGYMEAYQFIDQEVIHESLEFWWYRIRMLNFSGQESLSQSVRVQISQSFSEEFLIFPNPSNGQFSIRYSLQQAVPISAELVNQLGQIVWQQQYHWSAGKHTEGVSLPFLSQGTYHLILQSPAYRWQKTLIIKP